MVQLALEYNAVTIYSQYNVAKAKLDCRINIDGSGVRKRVTQQKTHKLYVVGFLKKTISILFYRCYERSKTLWLIHSKVCKHLTVKINIFFNQPVYELAVRHSLCSYRSVDTCNP